MIIFIGLLALICLYKLKFSSFHNDYMGKDQTGAIKGIFAVIIFCSHIRGYTQLSNNLLDNVYVIILGYLGQLMVTCFFFYSGYGVLKSYIAKDNYSKSFVKNRILKTLLHFDIAVLCYLVLALILKFDYLWYEYLYAFTGWTSLGNSNWFIFVMLMLYLITALSFILANRISKSKEIILFSSVAVLSIVLITALILAGKDRIWSDTLLCYPAGMLFAIYEDKISAFLKKKKLYGYGAIILSFAIFVISFFIFRRILPHVIAYNITSILFCLTIVLITTKIKVDNVILRWLGKYSFFIYIFQRLPMIIFANLGLNVNKFLFFILCLITTLFISVVINKFYEKLDKKLFSNKNMKTLKREI